MVCLFATDIGHHCSSYKPLNIAELQRGNCQQIESATSQHWLKVECKINRYYEYKHYRRCRLSWCHYFASCLHQTADWKNLCSVRFYYSSQFDITTAAGGINASHFKNIHARYCGKKHYGGNYFGKTFAIKISSYECKTKSNGKGLY